MEPRFHGLRYNNIPAITINKGSLTSFFFLFLDERNNTRLFLSSKNEKKKTIIMNPCDQQSFAQLKSYKNVWFNGLTMGISLTERKIFPIIT